MIPTKDFIGKSKNKNGWKRGILNYYFVIYPNGDIIELRDVNQRNLKTEKKKEWRIYTKYKNAFDLLQ